MVAFPVDLTTSHCKGPHPIRCRLHDWAAWTYSSVHVRHGHSTGPGTDRSVDAFPLALVNVPNTQVIGVLLQPASASSRTVPQTLARPRLATGCLQVDWIPVACPGRFILEHRARRGPRPGIREGYTRRGLACKASFQTATNSTRGPSCIWPLALPRFVTVSARFLAGKRLNRFASPFPANEFQPIFRTVKILHDRRAFDELVLRNVGRRAHGMPTLGAPAAQAKLILGDQNVPRTE